jgi:hypothetical protein
MNAYTLVGPTKRYPCDFNCFANASACGVDLGRSATDRGARWFGSPPELPDRTDSDSLELTIAA